MAINLTKGGERHIINLQKHSDSITIHANLNWTQVKLKGFFSNLLSKQEVDLDLGCMFELIDGSKGVIQPLGNSFGSKSNSPYILLDKDDRSGNASDGENMFVYKPALVKRVVFFALIYQGAPDFNSVNAKMFFKISNGETITLDLDNAGSSKPLCAAALFTNNSGQYSIQKEARYFPSHQETDKHYGFGFNWVQGSKD